MYKIKRNNNVFEIVEKKTSRIVQTFDNFKNAYRFSCKLNGGVTAFEGEIPDFILKSGWGYIDQIS